MGEDICSAEQAVIAMTMPFYVGTWKDNKSGLAVVISAPPSKRNNVINSAYTFQVVGD
jgi:hypothetical protein